MGQEDQCLFRAAQEISGRQEERRQGPVALVLNRAGHVISADVAESSGDRAYDDAAVAMVHRSDPVPTAAALTEDQFSFTLPVIFTRQASGSNSRAALATGRRSIRVSPAVSADKA